MAALSLVLMIPLALWLGQNLLMHAWGRGWAWRPDAGRLPSAARQINRVLTNVILAGTLVGYPLCRGQAPTTYYGQFFPDTGRAAEALFGAAAAVLYLALLYLAWLVSDNVRFERRLAPRRLLRRLLSVPLNAVLVALMEELLFRGVLLAGLLEWLSPPAAISVGVLIFAAAHYLRPVKRYWTFPGHVALGILLCLTFWWSGALWLPIGIHAGGVLVLMMMRPFIRYTGPAWLVGASIFPYAGAVGMAALVALTINMYWAFGGRS